MAVFHLHENQDVDSAVVIAESRQHPVKALEINEESGYVSLMARQLRIQEKLPQKIGDNIQHHITDLI